jgi:hypothetical protein
MDIIATSSEDVRSFTVFAADALKLGLINFSIRFPSFLVIKKVDMYRFWVYFGSL